MQVVLLDPIPVSAVSAGLRDGAEGQPQLHAAEIIDYIAKMRKPRVGRLPVPAMAQPETEAGHTRPIPESRLVLVLLSSFCPPMCPNPPPTTHDQESFACIAVTMVDIYPRPEWNFVFGLARAADASGVYRQAWPTRGAECDPQGAAHMGQSFAAP